MAHHCGFTNCCQRPFGSIAPRACGRAVRRLSLYVSAFGESWPAGTLPQLSPSAPVDFDRASALMGSCGSERVWPRMNTPNGLLCTLFMQLRGRCERFLTVLMRGVWIAALEDFKWSELHELKCLYLLFPSNSALKFVYSFKKIEISEHFTQS